MKKQIRRLLYKNDTDSFWKNYKKAQAGSVLHAVLCRRRYEKYGAFIPVTRGIQPFNTPHQFYGIFISQGTVIGKNTSVYPLNALRGVYPSDCIVKSSENVVKREQK